MTTPRFSKLLLLLVLGGCDPSVVEGTDRNNDDRATCRLLCAQDAAPAA